MKNSDLKYTDDLLFSVTHEKSIIQHLLLYVIAIALVLFVIFIYYAKIDERVKGTGKVVPKTRVVNIQSLEGGLVDTVYKVEGDIVKKGDKLIKLNPIRDQSKNAENQVQILAYRATKVRLLEEVEYALDKNISLVFDKDLLKYTDLQKKIFQKRILNLQYKVTTLKYQEEQKNSQKINLRIKIKRLKKSEILLTKELHIKKELHKAKALSVDIIYKLQREYHTMVSSRESYEENLIEISSALHEIESKYDEYLSEFRLRGIEELEKIENLIQRLNAQMLGSKDKLYRTTLRSSVNGIIKNVYFSHKNEVIKGAEIIMDILPTDDRLLIEGKISPKDIAFIAVNQKAMINITAYDFSIYGGLEGEIIEIGVDSILDKVTQEYFYMVKVITKQNFLLSKEGEKLPIMPGMIADVNIVTGKKSIFDFLFKPILKTYSNALHER
jgi:adhesin transport system membrane fusion protein